MPQALTLSPVIRKYGINLGAPYRPLSIRIRLKQIKLAGPPLSGTCIVYVCVCVCVCVGACVCVGGMYGSSSLCLSDTYSVCFGNQPVNNDYY